MEPTAAPVTPKEPKNNTTLIIAIVVVLVILCCFCLALGAFAWFYGDAILEALSLHLGMVMA